MKFLCPNCKAKYQISDEKIAGRTLKMDCRRCSHPIMIRGDRLGRRSRSSMAPAARAGSVRARNPLGSEMRRQTGRDFISAPSAPRPTALDQWHVAIQDVPVGPMRREEVEHKIAAGAVHGKSLVWREGFDDWRPLEDVVELASLLEKKKPKKRSPPPARLPSKPSRPRSPAPRPSGRGKVVPISAGRRSSAALKREDDEELYDDATSPTADLDAARTLERTPDAKPVGVPPPAALPEAGPPAVEEEEDPEKEAARGAAPVGPPPRAEGAPEPEPEPEPEEDEAAFAAAVASSPGGVPAADPAELPSEAVDMDELRRRKALSPGAVIGIAGGVSFGVALALVLGYRFLILPAMNDQQAQAAELAAAQAAIEAARHEAEEARAEVEAVRHRGERPSTAAPEGEDEGAPAVGGDARGAGSGSRPPAAQGGGGRTGTGGSRQGGAGASPGGTASSAGAPSVEGDGPARELTAEEQARLERFGAAGGGGAAPIRRPTGSVLEEREASGGQGLNGDQIRSVVTRNRRDLRQCYELATRGRSDVPDIRLDVNVTIGASGTVTGARARGQSIGDMNTCVERRVRRWRFPRSGATTETQFPVVFTGRG
jgi:predicted Zn finger-like uncharacterized protein